MPHESDTSTSDRANQLRACLTYASRAKIPHHPVVPPLRSLSTRTMSRNGCYLVCVNEALI